MRFDAYSTQLMRYYIPHMTSKGGPTEWVELKFEAENEYTRLDMFLSLDSDFYLIEEKPAVHVLETGLGIKFSKSDFAWCTNCYIYLIANIFTDQRYYITSKSVNQDARLNNLVPTEIMVNPF